MSECIMMPAKGITCLLLIICALGCTTDRKVDLWIASAPAGDRLVEINPDGETIIPNGRIVDPAGQSILVAPHPYGLTLSPDGRTAITANSGTSPISITIIREILSPSPDVQLRRPKTRTI